MKFPMKFEIQATATCGVAAQWSAQTNALPPIPSAIPPEFMGPGGGYAPEDLFAIALLNCLIATYKVYCEKSQVQFKEIKGRIKLTLDKLNGQTGFGITQADIFIDVIEASDKEKAKKLLDTAIKDCAVSNSIKTGKTFHIQIS